MTTLTLSLSALTHNLSLIRTKLHSRTRLIGVVKADAYGLGSIPIAKRLIDEGVTYLAVAFASEGIALRQAGIRCPILVFYPQWDCFPSLIQHCLQPVLYSQDCWKAFCKTAQLQKVVHYPVHVKFNTGLNRIGFSFNDCEWIAKQLENKTLALQSVYSHLAASEEAQPNAATTAQWKGFQKIKSFFETREPNVFFHLLNTSGIFNYPHWQMDAVRVGIGLYGFANRPEWDLQLEPIAKLETHIVQIHSIKKGETVGYNPSWVASEERQIAVLPLGHADGIGRQFGNGKGKVRIHNQYATIVGNVCMDMLMVDVSSIACKVGDPAVLFDKQSPLQHWATTGDTLTYEVLTGLSKRIARKIEF